MIVVGNKLQLGISNGSARRGHGRKAIPPHNRQLSQAATKCHWHRLFHFVQSLLTASPLPQI
jgi:hypothetical protein